MSTLWGLGLGLADSAFYVLCRKSYQTYLEANKLNSNVSQTDIWMYIVVASIIGLCTPIAYLWAAYRVSGLIDIHIIRCLVSVFLALIYSQYGVKDTINGYKMAGLILSAIGLFLVMFSSSYAS